MRRRAVVIIGAMCVVVLPAGCSKTIGHPTAVDPSTEVLTEQCEEYCEDVDEAADRSCDEAEDSDDCAARVDAKASLARHMRSDEMVNEQTREVASQAYEAALEYFGKSCSLRALDVAECREIVRKHEHEFARLQVLIHEPG